MLDPVLYMTSVRVDREVEPRWNAFYDDWIRTFVAQVPGSRRGTRWSVTAGMVGGALQIPEPERPVYLGLVEYARLDEFVLSRSWRKQAHWEPRVRSFDPWFRHLHDYATFNLIRVECSGGGPAPPPALLSCTWTVDPARLQEFEAWQRDRLQPALGPLLEPTSVHRYLALLAQLHRHGGPQGELVIPQRHHFEDGQRLCYVLIHELSRLPDNETQRAALQLLGAELGHWSDALAHRQEAFAERILLVDRSDQ